MKEITSCIEELRLKLERYRNENLREIPTRAIFIDPMLEALGWNVRDTDDVVQEYATRDGGSVDYTLNLNGKRVIFVEAKALNDSLSDLRAVAQVVGYAADASVGWCIVTNGITYKVFRTYMEMAAPADKLLFEVSIDPKDSVGMSTQQVAQKLADFSKEAMSHRRLDELGEHEFPKRKALRALEALFQDPSDALVKLVQLAVEDGSLTAVQAREAMKSIRFQPISPWLRPPIIDTTKLSPAIEKMLDYLRDAEVRGLFRTVLLGLIQKGFEVRPIKNDWLSLWHEGKQVMYMSPKRNFFVVQVHLPEGKWTGRLRVKTQTEWDDISKNHLRLDERLRPDSAKEPKPPVQPPPLKPLKRDEARKLFWTRLLERANKKTPLHSRISPGIYHYIGTGAGVSGLGFSYVIREHNGYVELYIGKGTGEENKQIFDRLMLAKDQIEKDFCGPLEWQRLDKKQACRICKIIAIGGWQDEDKWPQQQDAMIDAMINLEKALRPHLDKL